MKETSSYYCGKHIHIIHFTDLPFPSDYEFFQLVRAQDHVAHVHVLLRQPLVSQTFSGCKSFPAWKTTTTEYIISKLLRKNKLIATRLRHTIYTLTLFSWSTMRLWNPWSPVTLRRTRRRRNRTPRALCWRTSRRRCRPWTATDRIIYGEEKKKIKNTNAFHHGPNSKS